MTDQTPSPKSVVYVEVSGLTGSGKSAIMGEIEIALKALGLTVEHDAAFQAEKNGTHADWQGALDLYKPTVVLTERNMSRAPAPSSLAGGEVTNDDTPTYMRLAQALSRHPEVMVVERSDPSLELTADSLEHLLEDVFPLAVLSPEAPAREGAKLIRVVDDGGFTTLHEPDEDGGAGDLVASVWRDDYLPRLKGELSPSVAWACAACNSPRAVNPCQKCGTELTKPADGWDWPRLPNIERIRELAREVGYAVGVHGTLERDLDLIAVPWIAEAVTPLELAQHIASGLGGNVLDYKTQDKPCGRWSCNINSDGWFKLIDLSVMTSALTPRHEAPAEGAGEALKPYLSLINSTPDLLSLLYDADMLPEQTVTMRGAVSVAAVCEAYQAGLRARSSAPEARGEALGNLLAVIHGDGGHRALEVGTKQAALEAEKIVANLLSSAPEARDIAYQDAHDTAVEMGYPSLTEALEDLGRLKEAREGEAVRRQRCTRCDRGEVFGMSDDSGFWVEFSSVAGGGNEHGMNGWLELVEHWPDGRDVRREYVAKDSPLYAAPSADKLRIAVEALEPFAKGGDHRTMPGLSPSYTVADFGDGVVVAVADFRRAAEALAALKAEG